MQPRGLLIPTAFAEAAWEAGPEPDTPIAIRHVGGEEQRRRAGVGVEGQLLSARMQRWANPNGEPWGYDPFGSFFDEEATFDGITIPSTFRVGYWPGTVQ